MKLLYGTGNPAKMADARYWLKGLPFELLGLKNMDGKIPDVPETGSTPLENARLKAAAYYEAFKMPVFSCDSGLYFDNVSQEDQPGIHVRTVNGKYLTDQEMLEYYSGLAEKYGGLTARYRNAICLILDENHSLELMDDSMASAAFLLTAKPHPRTLNTGYPLDSLSVQIESGKYYYDIDEQVCELEVGRGFRKFFEKLEMFDVVDESGEPTGETVARILAHSQGIRHRTAHVWLMRRRGDRVEILLQKRSQGKDSFPGCYDISSAGHIPAGVDYISSALRELWEELGENASEEELQYCGTRYVQYEETFYGKPFRDNQVSKVYLLWRDKEPEDFVLQRDEVEEVRWFDFYQVLDLVRDNAIPNCIMMEELEMIRTALENI